MEEDDDSSKARDLALGSSGVSYRLRVSRMSLRRDRLTERKTMSTFLVSTATVSWT